MHTGEIVDLANERRLSATLDYTCAGAELLILNGGSRAEELTVVTTIGRCGAKAIRANYCIDSGTSMVLTQPIALAEARSDVTMRIIGGHGEMVLSRRRSGRVRSGVGLRGWSTLAAATVLLLLAAGRLEAPGLVASADPEPAAIEAPLVKSNVLLSAPGRLPHVEKAVVAPVRHVLSFVRAPKPPERRVAVTLAIPAAKHDAMVEAPAPRMTDLHVPTTAKSGDFIPVTFGSVGRQVKIVASIGPTIVSKTIISAQRGVIAIHAPKSDLDSRIMTVRAYAQDGKRSSTLQAMVVLVHP